MFRFVLLTSLFVSQLAFSLSTVTETREYSQIFQAIDKAHSEYGDKLLVVFDIDDTLIVTEHCLKKDGTPTKGIGKFYHCPSEHTEAITSEGIAKMQEAGVHTLALTARGKNLLKVTERELAREHTGLETFSFDGLPFSGFISSIAVPKTRRCKRDERAPCLKDELTKNPRFKDGVFYAQGAHKGLALQRFLRMKKVYKKYTKIMFVDDRMKNTDDVAEVYEQIPFVDAEIFLYLRHRD